MKGSWRWLAILLLFITCAAIVQNPATAQNAAPAARRIYLDVQVTDSKGVPIHGLQQQDFTVLDGKQKQNIVSFYAVDGAKTSSEEPPAEVVLVIDAVNPIPATVGYIQTELKKYFLSHEQLTQPTSIAVLSREMRQLPQGTTLHGQALAARLDDYKAGLAVHNDQTLDQSDRFSLSLGMLTELLNYEQPRPGRKLVLWFGSGWPPLTAPGVEFSTRDRQGFFKSILQFSDQLRDATVTLYNIQPGGTGEPELAIYQYDDYVKGETSASRAEPVSLSLQVLAKQTGGLVFLGERNLGKAIDECLQDAATSYVVAFEAAHGRQPNEFHKIAVTVDRPKTTVRTRTGYYAQP